MDIPHMAAEQNARSEESSGKGRFANLLYWVYERRLLRQIRGRVFPRHVGFILDGNRRHGRQQGLQDFNEIYRRGAQKLDDVLSWCAELQIPTVTLWVFSTENLKRSPEEISGILAAVESKIAALASDPLTHRQRISVRAIGRLDILPGSLVAAIRMAEAATAQYDSLTLIIAVAGAKRSPTQSDPCFETRQLRVSRCRTSLTASPPKPSLAIFTRLIYPIQTSSSAPAARCVYPDFCSGRVCTPNSTSRMFTGQRSARSTSCARSGRSSSGRGALGSETATELQPRDILTLSQMART